MRKQIRIAIAEDHPFTRLGLLGALKEHSHIKVMFDVGNGKELMRKLNNIRVDIVLLDIEMPIMRAPEVLQKIRSRHSKIKVIIISAFFQDDYIAECFKLGAKSFLPKGDPIEKTLEAIETVFEKGTFITPEIARVLAEEVQRPNIKPVFSVVELDIIKLLHQGLSRTDIALKYGRTVDGVNYHIRKIMNKTSSHTKKDVINYAIKNGLT